MQKLKAGELITLEDGSTLIVGNINELAGVCDDCSEPEKEIVSRKNLLAENAELRAAVEKLREACHEGFACINLMLHGGGNPESALLTLDTAASKAAHLVKADAGKEGGS